MLMKKLYTLLLGLALTMSAGARTLTFWNGDAKIDPGATVEFGDWNIIDNGDYVEVQAKPELYIQSDIGTSSLQITATCTSGQKVEMCCGGACIAAENGTPMVKTITVSPRQKVALDFKYIAEFDKGEEYPVVTTHFEAVDTKYPETKKEFVLVMKKGNGSVIEIEATQTLKAVPGAISYSISGADVLTLYSMTGRIALKANVEGHGSLSTASLAKGLYIYRLGKSSGKVYIR